MGSRTAYFNSIKVQLKRTSSKKQGTSLPVFQFHKGTIKALMNKPKHKNLPDFNSIKVQLKPLRSLR